MQAKTYLKSIMKLDKMIENKSYERERLLSIAFGTTTSAGSERVQSSGSKQKMADAIVSATDLEKEIAEATLDLVRKKNEVIKTIEQLDVEEYDFLHKMYVQYMTFDDIANENGKSYSWATTLHGRALKSIQEILDGREKACLK